MFGHISAFYRFKSERKERERKIVKREDACMATQKTDRMRKRERVTAERLNKGRNSEILQKDGKSKKDKSIKKEEREKVYTKENLKKGQNRRNKEGKKQKITKKRQRDLKKKITKESNKTVQMRY